MVCVLATLKVKEEKISEFEELFIELTGQVRSNEEGNIFYQIAKDREQENTYVVLEHYNNQDSVDAHGKSDHFRAVGAKIGACLDGAPIIKYLDSVK
tara:strand:- start:175 stop:465 length:291 start_codon:yes stop_codon:yes gene_type:complete